MMHNRSMTSVKQTRLEAWQHVVARVVKPLKEELKPTHHCLEGKILIEANLRMESILRIAFSDGNTWINERSVLAGKGVKERFRPNLKSLEEKKLLVRESGHIHLTGQGQFFAETVFTELAS